MTEQQTSADEIAKRAPDGSDGHHWFKELIYRVRRGQVLDLARFDHTANLAGAVQAAVQNGLHTKGEPFFVGARPHEIAPDNHVLTYAVPVVPAAADTEPETTVTPTDVTFAGRQDALAGAGYSPDGVEAAAQTPDAAAAAPQQAAESAAEPVPEPAPAEPAPETPTAE
jgi:hypothetical protein